MTENDYVDYLDNYFDLELFLTVSPIREETNDIIKVLSDKYFGDIDNAYIYNGRGMEGCFINFPFQGPREAHKFHFITNQMLRLTKRVNYYNIESIFLSTTKEVYPSETNIAIIQSGTSQVLFREYVVLNSSRERWYGN